MDPAVHPAPAGRRIHYERRRPEETTLYRLVQEHLETFLAQVELETGSGLPEFVQEEFDAFPSLGAYSDTSLYLANLECGILAHGPLAPALRRLRPREARRLWSTHPWIGRQRPCCSDDCGVLL
jgi:hypothetical protein